VPTIIEELRQRVQLERRLIARLKSATIRFSDSQVLEARGVEAVQSVLPDFSMRFVPVGHLEKREAGRGRCIVAIPRKYQGSGSVPEGETTDRWVGKAGLR